jgi:hypothetical protein
MMPYKLTWFHEHGTKTVLIFNSLSWALVAKFAIERDNANVVKLEDCNGAELR